MAKRKFSAQDYEFMHSLSAATLESTPKKIRMVFYFWMVSIVLFIIWMAVAEVDEIVRGDGEIVPSGENQIVQNFEGGIIEEILVVPGMHVQKGDILIRIDNQKSESSHEANTESVHALKVTVLRLRAEAKDKPFVVTKKMQKEMPKQVARQKSLYDTDLRRYRAKQSIIKVQRQQKKQELSEARSRLKLLKVDLDLINEEVEMTKPMVEKGVTPKVEYLKLQREQNSILKEYTALKESIPRLKNAIVETTERLKEVKYEFHQETKEKLNEALEKLQRTQSSETTLLDQVQRSEVRSPINGIVQSLFVHTIGGSVKPAQELVEIVPSEDTLLVEVKVKPSDIAFIYLGQKAKVKFSAYDFAIYGGLEGEVLQISADSIKDEKDNTFFIVRIKTDKNYLGSEEKPLKIMPGMTVNVDIITGKKTILDYVLKPILKAKQYSFTEH